MPSTAAPRIAAGRGAHVWDAAGHEYIDWTCGYGPVVLGHGHPRVAAAVFQQLLVGTLLPGPSDIEHALGERLLAHFPSADTCLFVKTGSEAVSAAIRFARAHTGRRHVLRVGFHGWHDGLIDPKLGWHNWDNIRTPASTPPGVTPPGALDTEVDLAPSVATIETRLRDSDQPRLAALVLDPIQLLDPAADLPRIRYVCDETATLLVLDETKTAFRVALGGAQELYGIKADMTVAGKVLANGLPLSTVVGPADLVQPRRTRVKGTFSAERSALAAAYATLDVLETDDVCTHLATIGADLIATLNDALGEQSLTEHVTAVPYRWPSMPHLHAATDDPHAQRIRSELIDAARRHGVLLLDGHNSFACAAHDADDVRRTAEVLSDAASTLVQPRPRPKRGRSMAAQQLTSATHLLLYQGDALLMIRRHNTGYQDGNYSVVAGHIDPGEPARHAMRREAEEEAGIDIRVDDLEFVHAMHRNKADGTAKLDLFFRCTNWVGTPINAEPHKCDHMEWFHPDALPTNTIPYIRAALAAISNGHPFSEFGWAGSRVSR